MESGRQPRRAGAVQKSTSVKGVEQRRSRTRFTHAAVLSQLRTSGILSASMGPNSILPVPSVHLGTVAALIPRTPRMVVAVARHSGEPVTSMLMRSGVETSAPVQAPLARRTAVQMHGLVTPHSYLTIGRTASGR